MATIPTPVLRHQLPGDIPEWGNCQFSFDPEDRDYDWLGCMTTCRHVMARRTSIAVKN